MKLQISFNTIDLKAALSQAKLVQNYCDEFKVGSLLLSQYGVSAVKKFREKFPNKLIVSDTKIIEYEQEIIEMHSNAGCDYITVLAGNDNKKIHYACNRAHNNNKKIILDLIDSNSFGQSALEAKSLGVDIILFHKLNYGSNSHIFLDKWEMVKENTNIPIYISTPITKENIKELIKINPYGIVIGSEITDSSNPKEEAKYYYNIIQQ